MNKDNSLSAKRSGKPEVPESVPELDLVALKEEYILLSKSLDPMVVGRIQVIEQMVGDDMANEWASEAMKS